MAAGDIAIPTDGDVAEEQSELKRGISRRMLLFFVVGDILGAGIYARVSSVAAVTGGAIWMAFATALVLAALTAASYAELVTKYPGAAGAALYVNKAWGRRFFTFIVAFAVLASGLSSAGVAARAFGGNYLREFVAVPTLPVALGFILLLALVNFRGVSESVKVNIAMTMVELTGLLIVISIGVIALMTGQGDTNRPFTFTPGASMPLAILAGSSVAFYALIGFEDAVNMAEETQEPSRTFPRALFGGLALAGLIYILVGFTASLLVDSATLAQAKGGALLEVVKAGPLAIPPRFFSAIALIAITNTALINMIMASRVIYGMARQGILPGFLAKTHRTRQSPWAAILFTTALALVLVATGDLDALGQTTVLLLLSVFTLVNIVVLVLRRDQVHHEHFRVWSIVPILGVGSCVALITQQSAATFGRAAALLALGLVLYGVNILCCRKWGTREAPQLSEYAA